jgi:hypothetical protein
MKFSYAVSASGIFELVLLSEKCPIEVFPEVELLRTVDMTPNIRLRIRIHCLRILTQHYGTKNMGPDYLMQDVSFREEMNAITATFLDLPLWVGTLQNFKIQKPAMLIRIRIDFGRLDSDLEPGGQK